MRAPMTFAPKRAGFTLTELLVVITIIAILMGLSAGAAYLFITGQRVSATENSLRTFDKVLHEQWKKVVADANKETIPLAILSLANGNDARARVLLIKFRLAEAFPQSFAEITLAAGGGGIYGTGAGGPYLPNRKYMQQYAAQVQAMIAAKHIASTEPAACLYMALIVDRGAAKLDEGNMAAFIADTDGDEIKELCDSWGHAIQFVRFPIGNTELAAMNPRAGSAQATNGDPLDPLGYLQIDAWYSSGNGQTFSTLCNHPFPTAPKGSPPAAPQNWTGLWSTSWAASWPTVQPYWVPFVYSSGRDEIFGPNPPPTGPNDDIYSYKLKVGTSGN